MPDNKTNNLLLMLMGIVIMLMIAITGLFLRMTQLQQLVIAAIDPLRNQVSDTNSAQSMGIEVGTTAPMFDLINSENKNISFNSFEGQDVLLMFSSTHCPACERMYPHMKTFSEQNKTIQIVMVSLGSMEENQLLVSEYAFSFPVLHWSDEVAEAYQVSGTPFFFFIDSEGIVMNKGVANTTEQLQSLIKEK